jgi:transposase-like protein
MKQEKQQIAERLYFQSDLNNTEIAQAAGISRRTLHAWVKDNEWTRLKTSAQHMPSLLAENMYLITAKLQSDMLAESHAYKPFSLEQLKMLDISTRVTNRIKNRSTLNESLELTAHFADFMQERYPAAAETVMPIIKDFLKSRAKVQPHTFMAGKLTTTGFTAQTETDIRERQLDLEDEIYWAENPQSTEAENNATHEPTKEAITAKATPQPLKPEERKAHFAQLATLTAEAERYLAVPIPSFQPIDKMQPKLLAPQNLNRSQRRELARRQNKKTA